MSRSAVEEKCVGDITIIGGNSNMMSLKTNAPATTRHTQLLVAAIDHLIALHLNNPEPCLSLLINRNYKLLLEQNVVHPDRNNWLNQQQIWWQCYKQSCAGKPVGDDLLML